MSGLNSRSAMHSDLPNDESERFTAEPRTVPSRYRAFIWPALLLLGWVAFELTAQPAIGVVLACGKFGWEDFLTARWLRRTDPNPGRARACRWFYIAAALWKISITATVAMFLIVWVTVAIDPKADPSPQFMTLMLVAMFGFIFSSIVTYVGIVSAYRHGVKVWVEGSVHRDRRLAHWPPQSCRSNRAGRLLLTALILPTITIVLIAFVSALSFAERQAKQAPAAGAIPVVVGMLILIAPAFLILALKSVFDRSIVATTPQECWGGS